MFFLPGPWSTGIVTSASVKAGRVLGHWWCGVCRRMGVNDVEQPTKTCSKCGGDVEIKDPLPKTVQT